jgi:predicted Zn-dependent protease
VALAEEAVKLHPRLPLSHYILGRLYLESADIPHAIEQLEIAKTYVPDEPKIYFALSRAYAKANRKQDAERAREAFTRLSQQAEEAAGRGAVRGDAIPEDNPEPKKPQQH